MAPEFAAEVVAKPGRNLATCSHFSAVLGKQPSFVNMWHGLAADMVVDLTSGGD